MGEQEVRIQRQHHARPVEAVLRRNDFSERQSRAFVNVAAIDRLILMPARLGKLFEHRPDLCVQRRRSDRFREYPQPCAVAFALLLQRVVQCGEKRLPTADLTTV